MHAQGMGYAVCMYHSARMHFCRLQVCAEAQVYLMQECHASVACNLHVYLYIWRWMRNDARSSSTSYDWRVANGCAFLAFHRLPVQPSRLSVSAILKITCIKTINSLVPVYVTPFQIGSWRPFSFCVPSNSVPLRTEYSCLFEPPLSTPPFPFPPKQRTAAADESGGEKHAIKCNASLIESYKHWLINGTTGNPLTLLIARLPKINFLVVICDRGIDQAYY